MKCKLLIITLIFVFFIINLAIVNADHVEVNFSNIIDTFEFDVNAGTTPTSLIVSQNTSSSIIATFYEGLLSDGFVTTFEVLHNGTIIQSNIDSFEFDTAFGQVPSAVKISNNTYFVVYKGAGGDGFGQTIEIFNNGSITQQALEILEVEDTDLEHPNVFFIQEQNNYLGVTSSQTTVNGILGLGFIEDNGSINRTDRFIYNDTQSNRADSTNVSNNIVLIVYQADIDGDNFGGAIETIYVLDNGSVNHTIDYEILDATEGDTPSIARVNEDTFAIIYEGSGTFGRISTYNITSEGLIKDRIDSFSYDTVGLFPNALMIENNVILNVYENGASHGELIALEILGNASINNSILANTTYEDVLSDWQEIINLQDDIYLITYEGVGNDGFVKTINISSILFVDIVDIIPPTITLISPTNNTNTNIIPLNITFSVLDDSANDIICSLTNTTIIFDSGTFPQSSNSNLTLAEGETALSQEFPNLNLTCFDNTALNNSATLLLNYTLDTIPPIIFTISPADTSSFNKDAIDSISIKANCTDVPVFRFNITIENATDIVASFESRSPVNNFIVIDETLDITDLGSGFYDVNHTCADPHTTKQIADYNIKKNVSDTAIKYITDTGNQFKIRYLQNSLDINTFGSSKAISNDRYKFWFYTNETESKTKRTFIFEIISEKEVYYLENSEYRGHFITGNNWIDFEIDDQNADYIITKNAKDNYEIEITTSKTKLDFNSVGDLNIATITTQFEIISIQQITDDTFSVFTCPLESLQRTILFIFFIILSFGIMILGFNWKHGLIGTLGAFMLLILSAFTYACIIAIGILLTGLSIVLISFFVIKGTRNFI